MKTLPPSLQTRKWISWSEENHSIPQHGLADKRLIPPFTLQTRKWFIWSMPFCTTSKCFNWQEMNLFFPFCRLGNGLADKRWIPRLRNTVVFSWQEMNPSFPLCRQGNGKIWTSPSLPLWKLGNGLADKRWISPSLSADWEMIRYEPLPSYHSNWKII